MAGKVRGLELYYQMTALPDLTVTGFLQATYKLPPCGCQIAGAGTGPQPLRIVFCAKHREAVK